jgi:hypothetical protein
MPASEAEAYVSIRQHTSAYVSMRRGRFSMRASEAVCRHMLTHSDICYACERGRGNVKGLVCSGDGSSEHRASVVERKQAVGVAPRPARRCIRQHTSTYNIRQHTSAYVSIKLSANREHASRPAPPCAARERDGKNAAVCAYLTYLSTHETPALKKRPHFSCFFLSFFPLIFSYFFSTCQEGVASVVLGVERAADGRAGRVDLQRYFR